jgi:hypothetical protein
MQSKCTKNLGERKSESKTKDKSQKYKRRKKGFFWEAQTLQVQAVLLPLSK